MSDSSLEKTREMIEGLKDGSKFNPDQVQVTRWKDGKAQHIRFYS